MTPLHITRLGPFVSCTHVGLVRKHNEDAHGISPEARTAVVCDGMGGHSKGEVASATAVGAVLGTVPDVDRERTVVRMVTAAQSAVVGIPYKRGDSAPGTTIVVARFCPTFRHVAIGWCGDSRAYLFDRDKGLHRLTRDHAINKHTLSQALGRVGDGNARGEYVKCDIARGQLVMLCTDGLHGVVEDADIARVFANATGREDAVRQLMARVFAAKPDGAPDNVTIVLARVP